MSDKRIAIDPMTEMVVDLHSEVLIIERFLKEKLKIELSTDQLLELQTKFKDNSLTKKLEEELKKSFEKYEDLSRSLTLVCSEVPMEWLLTHQDLNLRKKGRDFAETLDAISKVDPLLIENCSTFGEVLLKWKAYGMHIESL